MFIGGPKSEVIKNIETAFKTGHFNDKVEVDDPMLSEERKQFVIKRFLLVKKSPAYIFNNWISRSVTDTVSRMINKNTVFDGLENIPEIDAGAIITSNHFNPLENTAVRTAMKKAGHRRMYVVSQESNMAMKGFVGYLMNYMDTIPIWAANKEYMSTTFEKMLQKTLRRKQLVLIYPEQEMWFNYRRPRPPKRGAYYYAAKFNVPIISCFVEIHEENESENEEFLKTRYTVHILPAIYPDNTKSIFADSRRMMQQDYEQKVKAYEKAYGQKIDTPFSLSDIAGWKGSV